MASNPVVKTLVLDPETERVANDLALALAEEEAQKPNQVLPKKALQDKFRKEIEQEFVSYRTRLENGSAKIIESLIALSKDNKEMMSQDVVDGMLRIAGLSQLIAKNEDAFSDQIVAGTSLQELAAINNATVEKLYQGAKRLFDQKQFDDSADAFNFLTTLNPNTYAFWMGLGNSEFHRKKYEEALWAFAWACKAEPSDPTCHLISSRCYKEIGEIDNAINALEIVLYVIEGRPEFTDWKPMVEQELVQLKRI